MRLFYNFIDKRSDIRHQGWSKSRDVLTYIAYQMAATAVTLKVIHRS